MGNDNSIPVIGVVYAFMSKTDSDTNGIASVATLIANCERRTQIFGIPVPRKRVNEETVDTRMLRDILNYVGYARNLFTTAQKQTLINLYCAHRAACVGTQPRSWFARKRTC